MKKILNFYDIFNQFRDNTRESMTAMNEFITAILAKSEDEEYSFEDVTAMISDGKHIITLIDQDTNIHMDICSHISDSEEVTSSMDISVADFDPEELQIDEMGVTLGQILQDVNDSYNLDFALDNINTQLLNYGSVSRQYAMDQLNSTTGQQGSLILAYLKQAIGVVGDEIDAYTWSQILLNLQKPLVDQAEEDNSFALQDKYVSIKAFVGGAILAAISSVFQIVGLVVARINAVIGIIISLVGSAINLITSWAVNDSFTKNMKSLICDIDTPLCAEESTYTETALGTSAGIHLNHGIVKHVDLVTCYKDFWLNSDDKYFVNTFMQFNIHPGRFFQCLRNQSASWPIRFQTLTASQAGWESVRMEALELLFDDYLTGGSIMTISKSQVVLPEECYIKDPSEVLTFTDEEICQAICINLFIDFLRNYTYGEYNNPEHWNGDNPLTASPVIIQTVDVKANRNWTYSEIADFIMVRVLAEIKQYIPESTTAHWVSWENMISIIGELFNKELEATINKTIIHYDSNTQINPTVSTGYFSFKSSNYFHMGYVWTEDESTDTSISAADAPVQTHMISWPDYTKDALLKSLLVFGTIVAVGASAVALSTIALNRLKASVQLKNTKRLNNFREQYDMDPTEENRQILLKQARKYNFKAKILGLRTYDVANNWMNDYDTSSGADQNSSDNNEKLDELIKRIGRKRN